MSQSSFLSHLEQALRTGEFIKLTLSKPTAKAPQDLLNLYVHPLGSGPEASLKLIFHFQRRDETKVVAIEAGLALLTEAIEHQFLFANLFTSGGDWELKQSRRGKTTLRHQSATQNPGAPQGHDRVKQRLVPADRPWLALLGVTDAQGQVKPSMQDKFRQINKFIEIVRDLIAETGATDLTHFADMGCGKGYLTFALYDYLTSIQSQPIEVVGVERRPDLVAACNQIAHSSGFSGLRFVEGDISHFQPDRLDVLIALHACDTATDDALALGVRLGARLLVAAPCCHKQVRRDMTAEGSLGQVIRFGILRERQAELLTDGLRALLLETRGYKTKVFEFIALEHTAKNLMISAVLTPPLNPGSKLAEIDRLKQAFGLPQHYLETCLPPLV